MKVELTEEMILAIKVGTAELSNSGDWCEFLSEEEVVKVFEGMKEIKELFNGEQ